jgi:hypothetical protein
MSKMNLFVAACAATLVSWVGASEAHAQTCAWQTPSPVVTAEGSYESNIQNCVGQDASNTVVSRVWINAGRPNASTRRSLICNNVSNVGILVAAQMTGSITGASTTRYRRGAAFNCNTTYTTASVFLYTATRAACQVGFGSACLTVKDTIQ